MSPRLRSAPRRIFAAAFGASMKNGIGHVFASVMRERTNPGQTTQTSMPSGASAPRSASPHVFTQLFDAEYDGHALSGA